MLNYKFFGCYDAYVTEKWLMDAIYSILWEVNILPYDIVHLVYMCTYTVEPPNKGHIGSETFVLYSEVVPISEVLTEFYCTSIIDQYNVIFFKNISNQTLLATV